MARLRVLVTGGAGFVGAAILEAIQEAHSQWELSVLDIHADKAASGIENKVSYYQADIRDPIAVQNAVQAARPDVIIHTAGIVPRGLDRYSRLQEDHVYDLNVNGTRNILQAAKDNGVRAFVFTSSSQVICDDLAHEYPNMNESIPIPIKSLVYGETKAKAECLVLEANSESLATCALRPSVIFGRGDYQLIPSIYACIAKGEMPWIIGSGDNLYDFTSVVNVAHAHVLAVENLISTRAAAGEAIFISNAQPITFRDFCLAVWAEFGHAPRWEIRIPRTMAWAFGYMAEWVSWATNTPITLCRGSVMDASTTSYADLSKARALLAYHPKVDLLEGIQESCKAQRQVLQAGQMANGTGQRL